jgi:hypothetical protein
MTAFLAAFKASRFFALAIKWGGVILAVLFALLFQVKWASRTQRRSAQIEIESRVLRQRGLAMKELEDVQAKMETAGADRPRDRDDLADRLRDQRY